MLLSLCKAVGLLLWGLFCSFCWVVLLLLLGAAFFGSFRAVRGWL